MDLELIKTVLDVARLKSFSAAAICWMGASLFLPLQQNSAALATRLLFSDLMNSMVAGKNSAVVTIPAVVKSI